MATSTIFTRVRISDPQQARKFIDAMEQSAQEPRREPSAPADPYLTDRSAIRSFMRKREAKKETRQE